MSCPRPDRSIDLTAPAAEPPFALEFDASEDSVRGALGAVRRHLSERGYDAECCSTVEVVLAEALNNIVEHAYAGTGTGEVRLEMLRTGTGLRFVLCDKGAPLPGLTLPPRRLPRRDVSRANLPEGGFGWFLIHTLTTALDYSRAQHENRLSFEIETNFGPSA